LTDNCITGAIKSLCAAAVFVTLKQLSLGVIASSMGGGSPGVEADHAALNPSNASLLALLDDPNALSNRFALGHGLAQLLQGALVLLQYCHHIEDSPPYL